MKYPSKSTIRIYSYFFYGIEKPIKIEAYNKQQSRQILEQIIPTLPMEYQQSKVVGESVVVPLRGVTEKFVKGVKFIWVGTDKSANGWMSEREYKAALNKLK